MKVSNKLSENSFSYTDDKPDMLSRKDEIADLAGINKYIKYINESIEFDDNIYDMEISNNVTLTDWIFNCDCPEENDLRAMMQEILFKQKLNNEEDSLSHETIHISLGSTPGMVSNEYEYIYERRELLNKSKNSTEYFDFMQSCFINCIFADNVLAEMKKIKKFDICREHITKNLTVLNDEALELYRDNRKDINQAIQYLTGKLLECSLDPEHKNILYFRFSFPENKERKKLIQCEPHMKLIARNSDLRIYFNWCDNELGKGDKVLIGRIGSHPYYEKTGKLKDPLAEVINGEKNYSECLKK